MAATATTNTRWLGSLAAFILILSAVLAFSVGTSGAQSSGGCAGGPFDGATNLDSDGDGVSDGDEVIAGTDECDPSSTPTLVCGQYVVGYDAATADTDADGHTDADEVAAGSDPCDGTSVIAATATNATSGQATAPRLALTGPSSTVLFALSGISLILIGVLALAADRRIDL